MKIFRFLFCVLFVSAFIFSCKHEISPEKIYGRWELQNDVKFSDLTFTHMYFFYDDLHPTYIVDPVINDTIYNFKSVYVKEDTLRMVDNYGKEHKFNIVELNDSALVLKDFPGANDELIFRNLDYIPQWLYDEYAKNGFVDENVKDKLRRNRSGVLRRAKDFPTDSLDINMKSSDARKFANQQGKYVALTKEQVSQSHKILEEYMKNKSYLDSKWDKGNLPFAFDDYFRQYIGYKKDGKFIVAVEMSVHPIIDAGDAFAIMWLKNSVFGANGGGRVSLHIRIDLDDGKVISFWPNGSCF